jgi:hypothetical protein
MMVVQIALRKMSGKERKKNNKKKKQKT